MLEIRFHGRGGQGTVLAAKMLADIVLRSGKGECMAIPEFGVERRGAPVLAYARISKEPILIRTRIYEPNVVVVLDTNAAPGDTMVKGLKKGGVLLINTEHSQEELEKRWPDFNTAAIPAKKIALKHKLGTAASPVLNTAIIGAMCAQLDLVALGELEAAIRDAVPVKLDENVAAAKEAYEYICARRNANAAA
ncbi:MAG: 2-oxoacid:acceptor oxidoreductase family protein [Elusimicrobiota bacterium]